jgi:hypothetical protein
MLLHICSFKSEILIFCFCLLFALQQKTIATFYSRFPVKKQKEEKKCITICTEAFAYIENEH